MDPRADLKQEAAEAAVGEIRSGMAVGLGTGSTAIFATRRVGALIKSGELQDIVAFATSTATRREAEALGIPLLADELPCDLDVTIDGADEVDPALDLIKGGGGAHLREKLVAQATRRELIVVDDSKLSPRLGTRHPVPLEVLELGWSSQDRYVASLGGTARTRLAPDGRPVRTDQGNLILDADFGPIDDPFGLAAALDNRAGIVAHGLFLGLTSAVVVAGADGVRWLTPPGAGPGSASGTARTP